VSIADDDSAVGSIRAVKIRRAGPDMLDGAPL
jgi:hypothetical protein